MSRELFFKNKTNWVFLGICIVGFILRIYNINAHDFWFDEVLVVNRIQNVDPLLNIADKHPLLYFFIIKIWSNLFGINEFTLRFFSAFFGVLSIILIYKITNLFFDKLSALIAASFISFSPFHIWYAQEARMFTFSIFLSLVSTYFFLKAIRNDSGKYWVGYFFSTVVFIFTTYFAFFLLAVQIIIAIYYNRKYFMKLFVMASAAIFLFIIFGLSLFIRQFIYLKDNSWLLPINSVNVLLITLDNFMLGYNGTSFAYHLVSFSTAGITFFTLFRPPIKNKLVFLTMLILPILLVFSFSKFITPIYINRQLIIFSPFLYILLSKGIISIRQPVIKISIILSFIFVMSFSLFNYYNDTVSLSHMYPGVHLKKPVKPIVNFFLQHKKRDDVIGFSNYGFTKTFRYYLWKTSKEYFQISKFYFYIPNTDLYYEKWLKMMHYLGIKSIVTDVNLKNDDIRKYGIKRLWLFSTSWARQGHLDFNAKMVKEWFDKHFPRGREWYIDGVWITLYAINSSR